MVLVIANEITLNLFHFKKENSELVKDRYRLFPLSRIMTPIRNLAHFPYPNGSGTILWRLPQLCSMGKASPGQLRITRNELFLPVLNCSQRWTCRL